MIIIFHQDTLLEMIQVLLRLCLSALVSIFFFFFFFFFFFLANMVNDCSHDIKEPLNSAHLGGMNII